MKHLATSALRGAALAVAVTASLAAAPARASDDPAAALVGEVFDKIEAVAAANMSDADIASAIDRLFRQHADVVILARSSLGPDSRRATPEQLQTFTDAFVRYISRKYAGSFSSFTGGSVEVKNVTEVRSWKEVQSVVHLDGTEPLEVIFLVSDRTGENLFFDMIVEGISLRRTLQVEIVGILEAHNGDIDKVIAEISQ